MKRITIDYILSLDPCYNREELEELFRGRKWIAPRTVCKEAKPEDALWLLLREDFFTEKQLRLLACDFAEHVQYVPKTAVIAWHARDARSAVRDVAEATGDAESVARHTAWFASIVTRGAEREWQAKRILEELGGRK